MSEILNATCAICGTKYHACNTCKSIKTFKPWRTITDTINCYEIYMAIHDYNNQKISKEDAKTELEKCTIPDKLQPHIKAAIEEIMSTPSTAKKKTQIKTNVDENSSTK